MRTVRWLLYGLAVLMLVHCGGVDRPPAAPIDWRPYDRGLSEAAGQRKPVLLYVHATWCRYCRQLDRSLADGRVRAMLAEHFVPVRADFDRDKAIVARLGTRGVPEIWFLDPDGNRLQRLSGYVEAETLHQVLTYMQSGAFREMPFAEFRRRQ